MRDLNKTALGGMALALMVCGPLGLSAPAQATVLAIDTQGGNVSDVLGGGFTRGSAFSLTAAFTVTGLGYFDLGGDGLSASHQVAIFTAAGALVTGIATVTSASALVASGSALGDWRFEDIAPTVLGPGSYVIAGYDPNGLDDITQFDTYVDIPQVLRDPGFVGEAFIGSVSLVFPDTPYPALNSTSVSFRGDLVTADAPEPASLALLGLGLLGLGALRRMRAG